MFVMFVMMYSTQIMRISGTSVLIRLNNYNLTVETFSYVCDVQYTNKAKLTKVISKGDMDKMQCNNM